MKDLHYSQLWGHSCGDCAHKGVEELAKVATDREFERLETLQRLHDLQTLT